MGIFDVFGTHDDRRTGQAVSPANQAQPSRVDGNELSPGMASAATKLVERLLSIGIDGKGTFDSAQKVAESALAKTNRDPEKAIDKIVADHLKLAAASGFASGLGGFVTMVVALPANVAGFYILATRMTAAIASVRGYAIAQDNVRSAVLLALVGADATDVLTKVGYQSTGRLAGLAAQRLPGPLMLAVNKAVGFRLLTKVGKNSLVARLGRGVPLAGGVLGAGIDAYMLNTIANHTRKEFPAVATLAGEILA